MAELETLAAFLGKAAAVISALSVIIGVPVAFIKYRDKKKESERLFEEENEKQSKEIDKLKKENTLICYGLSACLDGLMQLGCNHSVPKAKDMLDKHLNKQAHEQEE